MRNFIYYYLNKRKFKWASFIKEKKVKTKTKKENKNAIHTQTLTLKLLVEALSHLTPSPPISFSNEEEDICSSDEDDIWVSLCLLHSFNLCLLPSRPHCDFSVIFEFFLNRVWGRFFRWGLCGS